MNLQIQYFDEAEFSNINIYIRNEIKIISKFNFTSNMEETQKRLK